MSVLRSIGRVVGKDPGSQMTILIADDQLEVRRVLRHVIEKDGRFAIVGEAADGEQAKALVGMVQPDAVILDLAMPNTDGLEAIPGLLDASPGTKIVVFSSMTPFNGMLSQAIEMGASLVLSKHTPPRQLMKAVADVVKND